MNESTIRRVLGEFYAEPRPYGSFLPPELALWHCYATDCGHNILIVFAHDYRDQGDLTESLCPAPVKAVLRAGYRIERGYVVCDLPYSPTLGIIVDPSDNEF